MLKEFVRAEIEKALAQLDIKKHPIDISTTDKPEFGDYATNVAFTLSKQMQKSPRDVAEQLLENINTSVFNKVEVAGPGFLNFHLKPDTIHSVIRDAIEKGDQFGQLNLGEGKRVQVEYVSANPTGPLTVGHGRNAVVGDTVANILDAVGWDVTREYYFNDAGKQMRMLGESVRVRFQQLLGQSVEISEDHYQGEYLVDIAQKILDEHGEAAAEKDWAFFKDIAKDAIMGDIRNTLGLLGIQFDVFTNEAAFFDNNAIWDCLEQLKEKGYAYEKDGAMWYKATEFGAEKDRVLVRSSGEPTYRLPDIAYHADKLERGFDWVIDILGADHIVQTPDIISAVKVLGYDGDKIQPLFYQFVTLTSGGEAMKMSTRKANFVTLEELINDVSADAVRYFMISRSTDAQMEFDLELAKKQSKDNPVYYIQYAHTRIASILREHQGDTSVDASVDLSPLSEPEIQELIKKLDAYSDALQETAHHLSPHILVNYAHQLAGLFHTFYERYKVLTDDETVSKARLALVKATQVVLKKALSILGVSAPERM